MLRKAKEALERRNEHKVKEQKAGRDHYKEQVQPSVLLTKLNPCASSKLNYSAGRTGPLQGAGATKRPTY